MLPRGSDLAENVAARTAFAPTIAVRSPSSIWFRIALRFQPCGVIHVLTAQRAEQRKTIMTTFTIDTDNNITAHATSEAAAATTTTPFDSFSSPQEFAELAESWPAQRLLAIWSSLPGVQPIRKFQDRKTAVARIWERIQGLAAPVPAQPTPSAQPKAARHAKGGAQSAKAAPAKGKAAHKTTAAKKGKRAKKSAPAPETTAPRPGSKTAQVVAMLRRKNGATLSEIMQSMGWQKHTVRGFMAGAMKKAGHPVESFKPADGERTYRINP
jgi:hypothetical protein